jgi:hypothetical protein
MVKVDSGKTAVWIQRIYFKISVQKYNFKIRKEIPKENPQSFFKKCR